MAFQRRLLAALSNPALSLCEIADQLGLPLDQLSLVISRPDLASEIAALDALAAMRVRLVATSCLPAAANTARKILDDFDAPESDCSRETALRAARVLLRLANFANGPVFSKPPSPRAERPIPAPSSVTAKLNGPSSPTASTSHADSARAHGDEISKPDVAPRISGPSPQEFNKRSEPSELHDSAVANDDTDDLSDEETISLAAQLIRQGAFSEEQLGEVFRIAASELGEDPDFAHIGSPEALAAEFEAAVESLRASPDNPLRQDPIRPCIFEPECVPP